MVGGVGTLTSQRAAPCKGADAPGLASGRSRKMGGNPGCYGLPSATRPRQAGVPDTRSWQQREGHRTGRCSGKRAIPYSQQRDDQHRAVGYRPRGAEQTITWGTHGDKQAISGDAYTHTSRKVDSPEVKGRPTGPYPYPVTGSYSAANPPKRPAVIGFSPAEAASTDLYSRRTLTSTPYSAANTRFASVGAKYAVLDSSIRGGV